MHISESNQTYTLLAGVSKLIHWNKQSPSWKFWITIVLLITIVIITPIYQFIATRPLAPAEYISDITTIRRKQTGVEHHTTFYSVTELRKKKKKNLRQTVLEVFCTPCACTPWANYHLDLDQKREFPPTSQFWKFGPILKHSYYVGILHQLPLTSCW